MSHALKLYVGSAIKHAARNPRCIWCKRCIRSVAHVGGIGVLEPNATSPSSSGHDCFLTCTACAKAESEAGFKTQVHQRLAHNPSKYLLRVPPIENLKICPDRTHRITTPDGLYTGGPADAMPWLADDLAWFATHSHREFRVRSYAPDEAQHLFGLSNLLDSRATGPVIVRISRPLLELYLPDCTLSQAEITRINTSDASVAAFLASTPLLHGVQPSAF